MKTLNKWLSPGVAVCACGTLALGSVALAFLGPDRSGEWMSCAPMLAFTALVALALGYSGIRAVTRRRLDSALLHVGCACIMLGWLTSRIAERTATPERPAVGSMAMIDGDVSDKLFDGQYLTNCVGRVPFTVKLEHFFIEHYPSSQTDRDAGRMPPVKEYRSRVTITEPGKAPYVANVRVNHPVRVQSYYIYQMSWGESLDVYRRPVIYTVLQFIRDPGLPVVYAGFVVLFIGVLLFAARTMRGKPVPDAKEVSP